MKEQKKKRLIALLLFIACLLSGYMLFMHSGPGNKQLQSPARADSLIQKQLGGFNISNEQVYISSTQVDSSFSRKTYHIGVPYQFSKTQFHAELNRLFHPYSVETPATLTFPEEDMNIHLLYHDTVIRSISIQTDPDLTLKRNRISLLFVFDNQPDENMISQIQSLGDPIPIVVKVENPMEANTYRKELKNQYDRVIFWLQNENGEDYIKVDRNEAVTKLNQLHELIPKTTILYYNDADKTSIEVKKQLIANTKISFVDASNALMLHEGMGKASFLQSLDKLQLNKKQSMAIIQGNETTLSWLTEKLPELKKSGANIVAPPKANF